MAPASSSRGRADVIVFRGVHAFDPGAALDAVIDVVVENGKITRAGRDAAADLVQEKNPRIRVIDGKGRWLFPGFVDLHAHLREPGNESKEDIKSGLAAAAAGGFVDVCVMPNTRPVNDSTIITEWMVHKGKAAASARLHPICAITVGQNGEALTEMAMLKDAGAIAASDDGKCVTRSDVMRRALEYGKTFDLPIIQHAEDHALTAGAEMHEGAISTRLGLRGWPRIAEDIIVARDVLIAEYTDSRYHVAHLSTLGAARIVREAKSRGIRVTCEVTPHHLTMTHEMLLGYDTACKVNPPLREPQDLEALLAALADGTIDAIATDHAPHTREDKDGPMADAAPGMIGLELCLPMLLGLADAGKLPLHRVITALTSGPAKIVGLSVPRIREGAPADFTLVDRTEEWVVSPERMRTKSKNTPLLSQTVRGRVKATLRDGMFIHDELEGEGT
jgi:dihydroorotase